MKKCNLKSYITGEPCVFERDHGRCYFGTRCQSADEVNPDRPGSKYRRIKKWPYVKKR